MERNQPLMNSSTPGASLRRVRWSDLPLGAVIIDWPRLHNAAIPELSGYPIITERLRAELSRRYQFLNGTMVGIVDPSPELHSIDFQNVNYYARKLVDGLPRVIELKNNKRSSCLRDPAARDGLIETARREAGPYTLTKNWMRSISSVVRDDTDFGAAIWGPDMRLGSVGDVMGGMLAGRIPILRTEETVVDFCLDVSFSMTNSGKADFAYRELFSLIVPLARDLGTSEWRVWLLTDRASPIDWNGFRPNSAPNLGDLLARHKITPGDTYFAPFIRKVLDAGRPRQRRLCVLVSDGACLDRPETLRLLERAGKEGIEYLQFIMFRDDEHRRCAKRSEPLAGLDNLAFEEELKPEEIHIRSDDELEAFASDELQKVTDLAEAAQGGQLVFTWYNLFSLVTIDVYERFLGMGI